MPAIRPERTFLAGSRHPIGYVDSNPDGDDGAPLTDYDLIGSPSAGSGLFALAGADDVHFVCIPPPARDRDLGASVLLVADRLCRERRAMLMVDPPAAWQTSEDALRGLREFDFRSDHALLCFPRIVAHDRLRGRTETFANCGAVTGALARMDEQRSPWEAGPDQEILLRPGARPAHRLHRRRAPLAGRARHQCAAVAADGESAGPATQDPGRRHGGERRPGAAHAAATTPAADGQHRARHALGRLRGGRAQASGRKSSGRCRRFLKPLGRERRLSDRNLLQTVARSSATSASTGRRTSRPAASTSSFPCRPDASGRYQSFLVTHARDGSRVRPARSNLLPAGTRMTVEGLPAAVPADDTQRQRTLAQELFGHYREPRAEPSAVADSRSPIPPAAGRLDPETIARIHRDFGSRLQRF